MFESSILVPTLGTESFNITGQYWADQINNMEMYSSFTKEEKYTKTQMRQMIKTH